MRYFSAVLNNACAILVFFLCSCSSHQYRENQQLLTDLVAKKDVAEIEKLTSKKSFLPGEESWFLKDLEVGNAQYINGNYCSAVDWFDKALDKTRSQYTVDVSDKISSMIGVGEDVFYGTSYENSLTRFYRSLASYHVFNNGFCAVKGSKDKENQAEKKALTDKEKRQKLYSARSTVLEWNSWLRGRYVAKNDRLYIDDLLMRLWGAFLHEKIGSKYDLQTAKHLYEDAKDVAVNRMAVYKLFNKNSEHFVKNLDNKDVRQGLIDKENEYVKDVVDFANRQIERIKQNKRANLQVVLREGAVNVKKVNKVDITKMDLGIGADLISFASRVLGTSSIFVEMPYMDLTPTNYRYYYNVKNGSTVVKTNKIVLAEPVSEIAYTEFNEKLEGLRSSIMTSVKAKYLGCLTAAYGTIIAAKDTDFELLITLGAIAGFTVCREAIEESGKVDIRQWVSLPSNIFVGTDNVAPGEYDFEVVQVNKGDRSEKVVDRRKIKIEGDDKTEFIDLWV